MFSISILKYRKRNVKLFLLFCIISCFAFLNDAHCAFLFPSVFIGTSFGVSILDCEWSICRAESISYKGICPGFLWLLRFLGEPIELFLPPFWEYACARIYGAFLRQNQLVNDDGPGRPYFSLFGRGSHPCSVLKLSLLLNIIWLVGAGVSRNFHISYDRHKSLLQICALSTISVHPVLNLIYVKLFFGASLGLYTAVTFYLYPLFNRHGVILSKTRIPIFIPCSWYACLLFVLHWLLIYPCNCFIAAIPFATYAMTWRDYWMSAIGKSMPQQQNGVILYGMELHCSSVMIPVRESSFNGCEHLGPFRQRPFF